MKQLLIIALSSILFTSCATVIFTTKPDLGERHHGKIPAEWQGKWSGEKNSEFYISKDSINFGYSGFSYCLTDTLKGDFIYFRENYCFIIKKAESDSMRMSINMARINEKKEIECFDMNCAYFLKNQLITSVIAKQYYYEKDTTFKNLSSSDVILKQRNVNITMPISYIPRIEENSEKREYEMILKNRNYEKYLKNLNLDITSSGFITNLQYDFSFFKKYADEFGPTLVLRKDKKIYTTKTRRIEKRYERLFKKDAKHDLNRLLKTEL